MRYILGAMLAILTVTVMVRCIVQFQMNKEINYYRKYFRTKKEKLIGIYNPLEIKQIPEETIDSLYQKKILDMQGTGESIDWSQFAYVNYVTDATYLCNTLIMFNDLRNKYGTRAKLVLLVSKDLLDTSISSDVDHNRALLDKIKLLDENQVVVKLVDSIIKPQDFTPWNYSLTKLLIFNETDYERIIYLDNDALVKSNLDELFFLPPYIQFAAPLTYWFLSDHDMTKAYKEIKHEDKVSTSLHPYIKKLEARIRNNKMIYNHLPSLPNSLFMSSNNVAQEILDSTSSASPLFNFRSNKKVSKVKFASNLMVIKPSAEIFNKIVTEMLPRIINQKDKYDMDLINEELYNLKKLIYYQFDLFRRLKTRFVPDVLVLPFARYGLLSGSIRNKDQHNIIVNDILGYKRLDQTGAAIEKELEHSVQDAKYVHFSDYPLGKPWNYASISEVECKVSGKNAKNAEENTQMCHLWHSIYETYMEEHNVCLS